MIVTVRVKKPIDVEIEVPDGLTKEQVQKLLEDGELLGGYPIVNQTADIEGTEIELYQIEGEYL